jgi:hypothetical protein
LKSLLLRSLFLEFQHVQLQCLSSFLRNVAI